MSELEARHYIGQAAAGHEALTWAQETRAAMVDLKFCDLLGTWQHVSLPIGGFDESAFEDGLGFDGSSIRGWQGISESDMLLMPDASSAILDPATDSVEFVYGPDHAADGSNAVSGVQSRAGDEATQVGAFSAFIAPATSKKLTHP